MYNYIYRYIYNLIVKMLTSCKNHFSIFFMQRKHGVSFLPKCERNNVKNLRLSLKFRNVNIRVHIF